MHMHNMRILRVPPACTHGVARGARATHLVGRVRVGPGRQQRLDDQDMSFAGSDVEQRPTLQLHVVSRQLNSQIIFLNIFLAGVLEAVLSWKPGNQLVHVARDS